MVGVLQSFSLCPLIEQKSFLGLSKESSDIVVVTTNSNIVSRYQVSNQKLLSSWNTKGLTSPCVYDPENEQYIAIYHQNEIRIWRELDENIEKVKKYKFLEKLYQLRISPVDKKVLLIFSDGNVYDLDVATEQRHVKNQTMLLKKEEKLLSYAIFPSTNAKETICTYFHQNSASNLLLTSVSVNKGVNEVIFEKDILKEANANLRGYFLHHDCDRLQLFTFWSDKKLRCDCVYPSNISTSNNCIVPVDGIDFHKNIAVEMISSSHLALCGKTQAGIVLAIYSIKFNLILCQKFYDHCVVVPRLWCIDSKLFFILEQNLIFVPCTMENRKLSSLIGSAVDQNEIKILSDAEIYKPKIEQFLKNNHEQLLYILQCGYDLSDDSILDILVWCVDRELKDKDVLECLLGHYIVNDQYLIHTKFASKTRNEEKNDTLLRVIKLLDFIIHFITANGSSTMLVKWLSLLIDAFYLQFVLPDRPEILIKLKSYVEVLTEECKLLEYYKNISSVSTIIDRKKFITIMK